MGYSRPKRKNSKKCPADRRQKKTDEKPSAGNRSGIKRQRRSQCRKKREGNMKKAALVLASGSPRRHEILAAAGYDFTWMSPDADEIKDGAPAERLVLENARRKAEAALKELQGAAVLCADTVVCLDGEILGKPKTPERAREMLSRLSAKSHEVMTGWVITNGEKTESGVEICRVTMRSITPDEIEGYIATGSPLDKAGAYGIQDAGGMFVSAIDGDYYTVMGLPICAVSCALREKFGILPFEK